MTNGSSGDGLQALVDELARVISDGHAAKVLAQRAGIPPQHVPAFTTALTFWTQVVEAAAGGMVRGGAAAVAAAAARQYPENASFAKLGGGAGASAKRSKPASRPKVDRKRKPAPPETVDVVLLTALHEEYLAVLEVSEGAIDPRWEERPDGPFARVVARRRFRGAGGRVISVLATWADAMAGNATAAIAAMLHSTFRPRCLAMTGIAAGPRGKVELGDVIFGHRLFTHDTGKVAAKGKGAARAVTFKGDPNPYRLDTLWKQRVEMFLDEHNREIRRRPPQWAKHKPLTLQRQGEWVMTRLLAGDRPQEHREQAKRCPDWELTIKRLREHGLLSKREIALVKLGRQQAQEHVDLHPKGPKPPPPVRMRLGDIASGNTVIEDAEIFARIEQSMRKTIGLEMEAAAIASVADLGRVPWIVAKAICDFGDEDKDDRFHRFAARASAEGLLAFLRAHSDLLGAPQSPDGSTVAPETKPKREPASRPARSPVGPTAPAWDAAVPTMTRILESGPTAFVDALLRELRVPRRAAGSTAQRVATTIDALGSGPAATSALLAACYSAIPSSDALNARRTAQRLLREWLPRRHGDGAAVSRIARSSEADAVDDLLVGCNSDIVTEIHAAREDGKVIEVETRPVVADDGKVSKAIKGRRSLPIDVIVRGEIKSDATLAQEISDDIATRYPGNSGDTPDDRRAFTRDRLAHLRKPGPEHDPRYLVVRHDVVPEGILLALKRIYPPLRIVSRQGSPTAEERAILNYLLYFFGDDDDSGSRKT